MTDLCQLISRRVILLCLTFIVLLRASTESDIKALPDCSSRSDSLDSLVLVSLIDGRLFALNGKDGGAEVWNVRTKPGPMLSSSIHNLELGRDGHFLRMIPSLSGRLYQFNGENVELIPFTADDLLQSSFRFKDDIVLTGGKESRTYGIDARKGTIAYECSMKGCENFTSNSSEAQDVIVLKRLTHTVRAVEPRTSVERWNFSVARHNVKLVPDPAALCHGDRKSMPLNFDIRVIVPDGLVCGVSRSDPKVVLWQHKLEAPIVSAWLVEEGELKEVDLFRSTEWNKDTNSPGKSTLFSPLLYVGMHHKQLYIEESVQMLQQLDDSLNRNRLLDDSTFFRIPWLPVPAIPDNALGLIEHDSDRSKLPQITDKSNQAVRTTAMSVLYASEYVNENGFFLYSSEALKDTQCGLAEIEGNSDFSNGTFQESLEDQIPGPVGKPFNSLDAGDVDEENIIITSLWYWWKEVLLISIGTAVLVNCMLPQGVLHLMRLQRPLESVTEEGKILPLRHTPGMDIPPLEVGEEERPATPVDYTSRYLQDFQPVQCLGKGGFGVVFEARKKFDDCHYAVKRISLTNKEDSRERVLREVRALAKLDHNNIVRYFNSWLECPPPGWQEKQDRQWALLLDSGDASSEEVTSSQESESSNHNNNSSQEVISQSNSLESTNLNYLSKSHVLNMLKLEKLKEDSSCKSRDASDSYIVFGASGSDGDVSSVHGGVGNGEGSSILMCNPRTLSRHNNACSTETKFKKRPRRPQHLKLVSNNQATRSSVSYLFIQMQLCRKESLKDWLRSTTNREYSVVINFFEQIVMAVEYVHLNNLIHRDLKPSNIFFSMDGHIKIGDFGLVTTMLDESDELRTPLDGSDSSTSCRERHTAQVGTELYMSPEQRRGKPYNYKVDIYSLGLILFELLVPFGTEMERVRVMQDLHCQKFPEYFSDTFRNEYCLLNMMLDHHPDKRPTTFGIRARSPLRNRQTEELLSDLSDEYHFELPTRQRSSSSFHKSSSSSASSIDCNSMFTQFS